MSFVGTIVAILSVVMSVASSSRATINCVAEMNGKFMFIGNYYVLNRYYFFNVFLNEKMYLLYNF